MRKIPVVSFTALLLFAIACPALAAEQPVESPADGGASSSLEQLEAKAATNDPWAQLNLGAMYDHGLNQTPRDQAKAAQWYLKAAEQGLALAQFNLGHLYALGEGVEEDFEQALFWLLKASNQDVEEAQYLLGVMYSEGLGTAQNLKMAHEWLDRAIANGEPNSAEYKAGLAAPETE